jgi:hypothetical protein
MKKVALSCSLFLALAIAVMAAAPFDQQDKSSPRHNFDVQGVQTGTFNFEYWGPGFWDFETIGDATGTLRHLGLMRMYTRHRPTADGLLNQGTFTMVAASGDQIRGTYEGAGALVSTAAPELYGKATLVISGGTGRYAHAKGTLIATFFETMNATWVDLPVTWILEGTVSY